MVLIEALGVFSLDVLMYYKRNNQYTLLTFLSQGNYEYQFKKKRMARK